MYLIPFKQTIKHLQTHLIAIVHEIMYCNEGFEHYDPALLLGTLYE